jgi:hypothetical protein
MQQMSNKMVDAQGELGLHPDADVYLIESLVFDLATKLGDIYLFALCR